MIIIKGFMHYSMEGPCHEKGHYNPSEEEMTKLWEMFHNKNDLSSSHGGDDDNISGDIDGKKKKLVKAGKYGLYAVGAAVGVGVGFVIYFIHFSFIIPLFLILVFIRSSSSSSFYHHIIDY